MTRRDALRELVEALPPGTAVPLPREWVLELLPPAAPDPAPPATDRFLDVETAAARLGVSTQWLYRHHRQYGFTRHVGRQLRFSEVGLAAYLARPRPGG